MGVRSLGIAHSRVGMSTSLPIGISPVLSGIPHTLASSHRTFCVSACSSDSRSASSFCLPLPVCLHSPLLLSRRAPHLIQPSGTMVAIAKSYEVSCSAGRSLIHRLAPHLGVRGHVRDRAPPPSTARLRLPPHVLAWLSCSVRSTLRDYAPLAQLHGKACERHTEHDRDAWRASRGIPTMAVDITYCDYESVMVGARVRMD